MRYRRSSTERDLCLPVAVALLLVLLPRMAFAQGDLDRCPPRAFERPVDDPIERVRFRWRSDVEHRDAANCRYEPEIVNRITNEHDSEPLVYSWDKAGLFAPRSAPLMPKQAHQNSYTIPPSASASVEYNVPLYYSTKRGVHANTDVYVYDALRVDYHHKGTTIKLFSRIVGSGKTIDGNVKEVVLDANSFTDLEKSSASISFRTAGPVGSLAFAGIRDAPFVSKADANSYYADLKRTLEAQALSSELVRGEEIGFEPHDNSHFDWIQKSEFIKVTPIRHEDKSYWIPLPHTVDRAVTGKIFTVILDAKGDPAGAGFIPAVFAPPPKR